MKYIIVACSLLISHICVAQNPTLTKGETIDYLLKKGKEGIGYKFFNIDGTATAGSPLILKYSTIQLKNSGVEIQYFFGNDPMITYFFNPALIEKATVQARNSKDSDIGLLEIKLTSKVVLEKVGEQSTTKMVAGFPFLKGDPTNEARIVKAFMHLRDLFKAEEDPFK